VHWSALSVWRDARTRISPLCEVVSGAQSLGTPGPVAPGRRGARV